MKKETTNQKVLVTYYDETTRETTVTELKVFFNVEGKEWKKQFFDTLEKYGKAITKFAMYEIV